MRKIGITLGGVGVFIIAFLLLGAIAVFAKGRYDKRIIEGHDAQRGIVARDTSIAELERNVRRVDTVYQDRVREYPVYRDRLIQANPNNKPLQELAGRCDQLVITCEQRVAAADELTDSLRVQVEALRKLKAKSQPRLSAFALGGYDWLSAKPISQVGAEARIVGALSIVGYVEAGPGTADERIKSRGVVAAKFIFR